MTWKLLNIFNVPLTIHWSLLVFTPLYLFIMDIPSLLLMFLSVIPHEYGHVLAARWYKLHTREVLLFSLGGIAVIINPIHKATNPKQEITIALGGPLATFLIVCFSGFLCLFFDYSILKTLLIINVLMLAFNLLPLFPLDGGRVFRASLCYLTNFKAATLISVLITEMVSIFGTLSILLNIDKLPAGFVISSILIFIFLFVSANEEYEAIV